MAASMRKAASLRRASGACQTMQPTMGGKEEVPGAVLSRHAVSNCVCRRGAGAGCSPPASSHGPAPMAALPSARRCYRRGKGCQGWLQAGLSSSSPLGSGLRLMRPCRAPAISCSPLGRAGAPCPGHGRAPGQPHVAPRGSGKLPGSSGPLPGQLGHGRPPPGAQGRCHLLQLPARASIALAIASPCRNVHPLHRPQPTPEPMWPRHLAGPRPCQRGGAGNPCAAGQWHLWHRHQGSLCAGSPAGPRPCARVSPQVEGPCCAARQTRLGA